MSVEWGFHAKDNDFPVAVFNGHEIELRGNFGKITFNEHP